MPSFNIVKESAIDYSFRTQSIIDQYDLQIDNSVKEQFVGNINIENENWKIGVIIGASGSGKTTIARELFQNDYIKAYNYDNRAVIDNMPKECSIQEITKIFNSVGFATIWSWLKPYNVLSNGEKMRVDLARAILEKDDMIVFDEFTSVVDRTVAKTASFSISKAIRKSDKKFIAVTCHYDILEWLEPDWIYNTDEHRFFFALTNTSDQNLISKFDNAKSKSGVFLENITI